MPEAAPTRSRRRRHIWFAVGGLGAVLLGLYAIGWFLTGDRLATGTKVAGVDIGGLSADEAEQRLVSRLSERASAPLTVSAGGQTVDLRPGDVGLSLDVEATVANAGGGHSWNPIRIVDRLVGDDPDVKPVIEADDAALVAWVAELADQVDAPPVEPVVAFKKSGATQVEPPLPGFALDQKSTAQEIVASYLVTSGPISATGDEIAPQVDAGELNTALTDVAASATAGPVLLQLPGRIVRLRVADFAPALTLVVDGGALSPVVDADTLEARLAKRLGEFGERPVDAAVRIKAGRPVVIPARPGVTVDPDDVAEAIVPVLSAVGPDRRIQVGQSVAKPEFTTREAKQLRVDEMVSDFVTYFPYAEYRNTNQSRAAELINGTLLKPGQLFSFNGTVGERTEENGFVVGFIISNGVFAEELGGGVSQVVTTTYNAAFFAGLEDVHHKPHSFYIDRYPMGREATVAWPTVDLKFRNTTPYGVLIEAWVVPSTPSSQGEMHVRMWSTKYWDIEAQLSDQYNFTSSSTRYDPTDKCVETSGYGGFDVDVTRVFRRTGSSQVDHREVDHVSYIPLDTVICSAPPN